MVASNTEFVRSISDKIQRPSNVWSYYLTLVHEILGVGKLRS
jgi:hypothetical protein